MKRWFLVAGTAAILFLSGLVTVSAQQWVDTFGTRSSYQPPRYLSGYGMSDLPRSNERLEAARNAALAQLSGMVRTSITSTEEIRTVDTETTSQSRYTSRIQTATDLQISGARFEVVHRGAQTHVLAWVETAVVRGSFLSSAAAVRERLEGMLQQFDQALAAGETRQAEVLLGEAERLIAELHDATTVLRALDNLSMSQTGGPGSSALDMERLIRERRSRFVTFQPASMDQAAHLLARTLMQQIPPAHRNSPIRVAPVLYQDADFSSAFGHRMSGLLQAALTGAGGAAGASTGEPLIVVRGSYWSDPAGTEIQLTARHSGTGAVVGAAHTTLRAGAVAEDLLRPANLDIAIAGGRALFSDPVVDGGLDVEVWTDRGRNENALVFEEGDFIQFYFRVNQPAFLQLSYVLGTGETVLLEESFYIGIDRVNRVVELPYRFQVVPPFGVERLIVTAHSSQPPRPDVVPQRISGQWYDVFRSVGDAVVRTRGLVRERPAGGAGDTAHRVGETHLSITTVARSEDHR